MLKVLRNMYLAFRLEKIRKIEKYIASLNLNSWKSLNSNNKSIVEYI